jgi:hypothetical protein
MSISAISAAVAHLNSGVQAATRPAGSAPKAPVPSSETKAPASQAKAATAPVSVAAAALQESIETPTQTAKEARGGDHQAQQLQQKLTSAAASSVVPKSGIAAYAGNSASVVGSGFSAKA